MAFAPRAAFAASYSSGVNSSRLAVGVGGEPRELRAAVDLEEEVLVLAGGLRIAGALDGVAEVLRRQRRAVAVRQIGAQVKVIWVASSLYSHDSAAAGTVSWLVSSRVSPS